VNDQVTYPDDAQVVLMLPVARRYIAAVDQASVAGAAAASRELTARFSVGPEGLAALCAHIAADSLAKLAQERGHTKHAQKTATTYAEAYLDQKRRVDELRGILYRGQPTTKENK
jgi:hypothetical protein